GAETRRPAVVPDVNEEPHWKWVPGLDEDRFRSMLSVPIESGPRLVGVLNVQTVDKREFGSGDIDFLRAIAGQAAGILERSELQRRMEVQLDEIQLSHDIPERFTKLSLEGAGIPSLLEVVRALRGGRGAAEVERRLRGDLVEEVLAGGMEGDEAERVARQAERLGHRLPHRAWVVVLEPDDDETESALAGRAQQDRLDAALSGLIKSRLPGGLPRVPSASAVLLLRDAFATARPG